MEIDILALQRPTACQMKRAGKKAPLRSKHVLAAFTRPDVIVGQSEGGCYVFLASLNKGHDNVRILMFASESTQLVKDTIESIFLIDKEPAPVELGPHELDLRQFADGIFSGSWHVFEEGGFSFCFLCDAGYRVRFRSEREALETFAKIMRSYQERKKCQ